jgi:hypothetical protein
MCKSIGELTSTLWMSEQEQRTLLSVLPNKGSDDCLFMHLAAIRHVLMIAESLNSAIDLGFSLVPVEPMAVRKLHSGPESRADVGEILFPIIRLAMMAAAAVVTTAAGVLLAREFGCLAAAKGLLRFVMTAE